MSLYNQDVHWLNYLIMNCLKAIRELTFLPLSTHDFAHVAMSFRE